MDAEIIFEAEPSLSSLKCYETCGSECRGWCMLPTTFGTETRNVEPEAVVPVSTPTGEPRLSITLFTPQALYVPNTAFSFYSGAPRRTLSGSWSDFGRFLSRSREGDPNRYPNPDIAKRARGAWVPGTFRGTGGHANLARDLIETALLVVDVDAGDPHAVADVLSAYEIIIHSTYKHTPSKPRCRVVFRLASACMSARDYNTGERFIGRVLSARGFVVDTKASTLGRLAFLPMHMPGVEPGAIVNRGKPLDLDRIVAAERAREQIEGRKKKCSRNAGTRSSAYAAGALRRAADAIVSASSGERHDMVFKEAASVARSELGLDEEVVVAALLPAAVRVDPDEPEAEHERVIRDAIHKERRS
jgi:hypothetical protein